MSVKKGVPSCAVLRSRFEGEQSTGSKTEAKANHFLIMVDIIGKGKN